VDFRAYYAAFLRHCWGIAPRAVFGADFESLPLFEKSV